jgi:hypothetical protein
MKNPNRTPARLDPTGTAKPRTRLLKRVRVPKAGGGHCIGAGPATHYEGEDGRRVELVESKLEDARMKISFADSAWPGQPSATRSAQATVDELEAELEALRADQSASSGWPNLGLPADVAEECARLLGFTSICQCAVEVTAEKVVVALGRAYWRGHEQGRDDEKFGR